MKKYLFLLLLAFSFWGQAKCTLGKNTTAQQTVELDMTSATVGSVVTVAFNTNLNDTFSCNASTDKMYYATPLQDYIIELKEPGATKSIFMKLKLTGSGFPVAIGNDGQYNSTPKEYKTQEVINPRPFVIEASYVRSGTADLTIASGNTINLGRPAISILTDNTCNSSLWSWIVCWIGGKFNSNVSYSQNITFTVKHRPTTCRFSQAIYEIKMPDTTLNEINTATNTKSGSTNLILNCESIYNVTTNPVNFKVARGDWDESGKILKNTLTNGAKGVGFQIYNGTATTPLKLGDTLMNRIAKLDKINNQYTFPITAKYVRVTGESLRPGEVQSKVIFAVSYD
ncbi:MULTISPECIES: fimbrial protein [Citrobacter]|uniref:fimbrial protein n=1 Tax=Citrobacter TaxID=544 RepID=UPI001C8EAE74|nr:MULTISPECIES: fimbrial protein [Citrobacter]MBY1057563.1 type 1 fimbrial protein [Citrobacter europaeus]MCB6778089.1 fimbrial protein [Citrobacter sp. 210820-DFI.7.8]MCB6787789.1 fimbrial protein [Citrobacter sp. 210820-DFI.7.7]MCB8600983.1 fimbrial protein [Citrobacter europaeus]MCQ5003713.1 fimbrial protein [Citrobacter europaeus]